MKAGSLIFLLFLKLPNNSARVRTCVLGIQYRPLLIVPPHDVQVDLHVGLSHASGSDEIWGVDARIRKEVRAEGNHPSVS